MTTSRPSLEQNIPPQIFAGVGRFVPDVMSATRVLRGRSMKPDVYLWTSSHTPEEDQPSDWLRWCHGEGYGHEDPQLSLLEIAPAKVFTIDSLDDLTEFMRRAVTLESASWSQQKYGLDDYSVDWTATVRAWDADALRVTSEGHWATRHTRPFSTYSWDCESTAWVNPPQILSVEYLLDPMKVKV